MPLIACGINHKSATIDVRERVAFNKETAAHALQTIVKEGVAQEAVILSTCNRTELYTHCLDPAAFQYWLQHASPFNMTETLPHWYYHLDYEAVRHIMRVASGLDSMVLGEPQIFGQLREALGLAQQTGTIGKQLQRLFKAVFTVTKQIRADTDIGIGPVSVAYAAVDLAKHIFADLNKCKALLVGAGKTIELAAMHLANCGVKRMVIANRSLDKAEQLSKKLNAQGISLLDIPVYLLESDIVITATGSELPIISKTIVERTVKLRKHKPIFMVDLAVPRDIEPEVKELEDAYLYNVDDLQGIIQDNLKSRVAAAEQADTMIDIAARYFMRELQALDISKTIQAYRTKVESLREQELHKAQALLRQGKSPDLVLAYMAQALTNKIMHTPTTQLRQAAFDGELDLIFSARRLLDLEES